MIRNISGDAGVHGMAHITGGGIEGNLCRIIPDGLCAQVDLSRIKTLPIFSYIQKVVKTGVIRRGEKKVFFQNYIDF